VNRNRWISRSSCGLTGHAPGQPVRSRLLLFPHASLGCPLLQQRIAATWLEHPGASRHTLTSFCDGRSPRAALSPFCSKLCPILISRASSAQFPLFLLLLRLPVEFLLLFRAHQSSSQRHKLPPPPPPLHRSSPAQTS
jgi:hypothetical protein